MEYGTGISVESARPADVAELAELFRLATDEMLSRNVKQWNYTYPLAVHIEKDIATESCFVWRIDGKIAGTVCLDGNQDPQYKKIHWHFTAVRPLVIHRLCVHPQFQGRGLGKKICLFAEEFARQHGYDGIRLDAYSLNEASNLLYLNLGYRRANGYCYFHGNAVPFWCYDYLII